MNNISALNQVFANLHQSVAILSGRVNNILVEVDAVKTNIKNIEQSQAKKTAEPNFVTLDNFNKLSQVVVDLKTLEDDNTVKLKQLEIAVSKQEGQIKEIVETIASLKIIVDNLTSNVSNTQSQVENLSLHSPSLTKEDVQALIDNAINSLIGVLTSTSTNSSETENFHLLQPNTTLPTIEEDASGLEVVSQDDVVVNEDEDTQINVEIEQTTSEVVVEPTKKKGRGGRKPAIKK